MAREQPVVARDFLGLGNMADATDRDDAEGRHRGLLDLNPTTFLGVKNHGAPSKLHESNMPGLGNAAAPANNSTLFSSMAFQGMKHPFWNKPTAFQHLLPPRNLHEERFVEQSAENIPEKSFSHIVPPGQSWWRGDYSAKYSAQACDDHGPSTRVSGGFGGTMPKNAVPLSMPDMNVPGGVSDAIQKRMLMAGLSEKQDSAPLTIFYGGNVNVFNDISAEKAKVIMFLAAGGSNMQGSPLEKKFQVDLQTSCPIESCQMAANQVGFGNASMQLDFGHPNIPPPSSPGQPVVPRALPQARKASLARFLEKRRERVHSKSPYLLKQMDSTLPEERFSSSNDMASYKACNKIDDKKRMTMPSWMERVPEFSTCDIVVKEETDVAA